MERDITSDNRDLYSILGVARDASQAEIKKAHRLLERANNPSMGGDENTYRHIQMAYETLGNVEKRREYDRLITSTHDQLRTSAHNDIPQIPAIDTLPEEKRAEVIGRLQGQRTHDDRTPEITPEMHRRMEESEQAAARARADLSRYAAPSGTSKPTLTRDEFNAMFESAVQSTHSASMVPRGFAECPQSVSDISAPSILEGGCGQLQSQFTPYVGEILNSYTSSKGEGKLTAKQLEILMKQTGYERRQYEQRIKEGGNFQTTPELFNDIIASPAASSTLPTLGTPSATTATPSITTTTTTATGAHARESDEIVTLPHAGKRGGKTKRK